MARTSESLALLKNFCNFFCPYKVPPIPYKAKKDEGETVLEHRCQYRFLDVENPAICPAVLFYKQLSFAAEMKNADKTISQ